jgi:hypothetical protein
MIGGKVVDDLEELKALIVANLDVVEFLDLIGLELVDLVNLPEVEEQIEENYSRLVRAVR